MLGNWIDLDYFKFTNSLCHEWQLIDDIVESGAGYACCIIVYVIVGSVEQWSLGAKRRDGRNIIEMGGLPARRSQQRH